MTRPPAPSAFTRAERGLIEHLTTPRLVQGWLCSLPYNHDPHDRTARSFRGVVAHRTAHCFEAAVSAATILEQHGYPPLLLDLESEDARDHVLFLFRDRRAWGSVGRSREPGLHGRRPVFRTVRALVDSYRDAYVDETGRVTGYAVLDLRALPRSDWRLSRRNLRYVERALTDLPHRWVGHDERRHRRVLARYRAFKRRHPELEPAGIYAGRQAWM